MKNILKPETLHYELLISYKTVMQELIDNVKKFLYLKEGDVVKIKETTVVVNVFGFFRGRGIYCIYSSEFGGGWVRLVK
jgi:hypothetical protein